MKQVHGYIRVSRDRDKEKLSPEIQRRRVSDYCKSKRWTLLEIFEDVDIPSIPFEDRPGWEALTERIDECDVIVATEFTRVGRSLRETLNRIHELNEAGKDIVAIDDDIDTTNAMGKAALHMALLLAQFERDRLSERLQAMHGQIAREGRWSGGITPFGYEYVPGGGMLVIDEEEAKTVREIYRLRDGGMGITAVVKEMASRGIPGRRGRMNYTSVKQILRNPTYVAKRVYNGETYDMGHEPIIPLELWERVQARNRLAGRQNSNRRYLLSGFLVCGDCGSRMNHQTAGIQGGKRRGMFVCRQAKEFREGRLITIEDHLAHEWVTEAVFRRLDEKKLEARKERVRKRAPKKKSRIEGLRRQAEKVNRSIDRLMTDYYDADPPMMTADQFRKKNTELLTARAEMLAEIQELEDRARLDNVVLLADPSIVRQMRDSWGGMTLEEQREVLRLFLEEVVVNPGRGKERIRIKWK